MQSAGLRSTYTEQQVVVVSWISTKNRKIETKIAKGKSANFDSQMSQNLRFPILETHDVTYSQPQYLPTYHQLLLLDIRVYFLSPFYFD
jgi:hypothetical protein